MKSRFLATIYGASKTSKYLLIRCLDIYKPGKSMCRKSMYIYVYIYIFWYYLHFQASPEGLGM